MTIAKPVAVLHRIERQKKQEPTNSGSFAMESNNWCGLRVLDNVNGYMLENVGYGEMAIWVAFDGSGTASIFL